MIKLEWSSGFERALRKWLGKRPADRDLIKSQLEIFTDNPFDPELKNHKLSGK
jgi:mRNA-degrading endonuclease YafQ of YafQ-DinJ toxin-antitoxin module